MINPRDRLREAEVRPDEERVEKTLREFYRAEMPRSWPPLLPEEARPETPARGAGLWRGRMALAAAVCLLLGGLAVSGDWLRRPGTAAAGAGALPGSERAFKPGPGLLRPPIGPRR